MPVRDRDYFLGLLRGLMPRSWYPTESPILDAVLTGVATSLAWVHALVAFARLQTRLATATGEFLDLLAWDYLGTRIAREPGETDAEFRLRVRLEILRERATRPSLLDTLTEVTGNVPLIIEPGKTSDCASWNTPTFAWGVSGYLGSLEYPYQALVTAYRPADGGVSDAQIRRAAAAVIPFGTVAWVAVTDLPDTSSMLDIGFILDESELA